MDENQIFYIKSRFSVKHPLRMIGKVIVDSTCCAKSSEFEYFTPLFDIIAIIFLNILSNISIKHSNFNFLNTLKKSMSLLYRQVKKYKGPKKIY